MHFSDTRKVDGRTCQEKVSSKDCKPPPPWPPDKTPIAMLAEASKYVDQKTKNKQNVSHERSGTGCGPEGFSLRTRRRGSDSVAAFVSCSCSGAG